MGRREIDSRPAYYHFTGRWPSEKTGRYWKRCLSKARRRAWKTPNHPGGLLHYETTCNYKTW